MAKLPHEFSGAIVEGQVAPPHGFKRPERLSPPSHGFRWGHQYLKNWSNLHIRVDPALHTASKFISRVHKCSNHFLSREMTNTAREHAEEKVVLLTSMGFERDLSLEALKVSLREHVFFIFLINGFWGTLFDRLPMGTWKRLFSGSSPKIRQVIAWIVYLEP